jgi:hypothetical protein
MLVATAKAGGGQWKSVPPKVVAYSCSDWLPTAMSSTHDEVAQLIGVSIKTK